jgi:hypothetical protein
LSFQKLLAHSAHLRRKKLPFADIGTSVTCLQKKGVGKENKFTIIEKKVFCAEQKVQAELSALQRRFST